MLAARDQENLIHTQQAAAASKPLNQGLAPKTPGPNGGRPATNGRMTGRRLFNENDATALDGKSKAAAEKNAFQTPAPRDRAPLGAKTTNAKAKAFQTPAPLTGGKGLKTQQRTSARRPKLRVHHTPEVVAAEPISKPDESDEEADIEYCPPKITELPDYPDPDDPLEFKPDQEFPQFSKENRMRGAWQLYENPIGPDGLTKTERHYKEKAEEDEKYIDELLAGGPANDQVDASDRAPRPARSALSETTAAARTKSISIATNTARRADTTKSTTVERPAPSSIRSREAAATLAGPGTGARVTAPTASSKAKTSAALASAARPALKTAGNAASRSTIGYSKGRKVSSELRKASGQEAKKPTSQARSTEEMSPAERLLDQWNRKADEEAIAAAEEKMFKESGNAEDWVKALANEDIRLELPDE